MIFSLFSGCTIFNICLTFFVCFLVEDAYGAPIAQIRDEAIPFEVIHELDNLQRNHHMSVEDAVTRVRGKLVPDGYQPYPFRSNTPESFLDKLRSSIGTYRFRARINEYTLQGIDFSTYLYIPEVDPVTKEIFHEREDHCHVLKRIWKDTREGGPEDMDLQGFDEVMRDSKTGLTYAALTGQRKQSVQDAERMLSFLVSAFLEEKGYNQEALCVKIVVGTSHSCYLHGKKEVICLKKANVPYNVSASNDFYLLHVVPSLLLRQGAKLSYTWLDSKLSVRLNFQ